MKMINLKKWSTQEKRRTEKAQMEFVYWLQMCKKLIEKNEIHGKIVNKKKGSYKYNYIGNLFPERLKSFGK